MQAKRWGRMSLVAAAAVFAVSACSTADDANTDTGAVTSSAGGDVATSPSPAIVMGYLSTINRGEVEAGTLAREKATNAAVRDYAKMMVTDHGRALIDGAAVFDTALTATPVGQPAVDAHALHEQAMNTLEITSRGKTFDSTYIAMMVSGHQDVLARLEEMKGTGSSATATPPTTPAGTAGTTQPAGTAIDQVHTQLQSAIDMVRTHLQRAQEIQQTLQNGG
jgi:putative membrane protein